ncbi:MAG: hypothetical protein IJY50_00810 [Clostridia bacterium]|nr:hypothetical protein [Clostridia bacterium]
MANLYYADRIGEIDGTKNKFPENLYLLDDSFHVLGVREATNPERPCLRQGDDFFAAFPLDPAEGNTLSRALRSLLGDSLLLEAGGRPVLIVTAFFARTRTLLAVVPEKELIPVLDCAAHWADILSEMHLQFSLNMLARKSKECCESDYRTLTGWLQRIQSPVFAQTLTNQGAEGIIAAIAYRLGAVASLCGCRLSYDLKGLGYTMLPSDNMDLLTGLAFSVFMAIRRIARDQQAVIEADRIYTDDPMLYVIFHRIPDDSPVVELEGLIHRASTTGETLCMYDDPKGTDMCYIQFSFFPKELSAQGIKHPQIYRY